MFFVGGGLGYLAVTAGAGGGDGGGGGGGGFGGGGGVGELDCGHSTCTVFEVVVPRAAASDQTLQCSSNANDDMHVSC